MCYFLSNNDISFLIPQHYCKDILFSFVCLLHQWPARATHRMSQGHRDPLQDRNLDWNAVEWRVELHCSQTPTPGCEVGLVCSYCSQTPPHTHSCKVQGWSCNDCSQTLPLKLQSWRVEGEAAVTAVRPPHPKLQSWSWRVKLQWLQLEPPPQVAKLNLKGEVAVTAVRRPHQTAISGDPPTLYDLQLSNLNI